MKKKNHLKKLALLGITSGVMMASQGQAEMPSQQQQQTIENQIASNYNYNYSGNYIRRGNYAYSKNRGCCDTNTSSNSNENAWGDRASSSCGGASSCSGQSHPQTPASSCGAGSHGCGGQSHPQAPASSCAASGHGCGGQLPPNYYNPSNGSSQDGNQPGSSQQSQNREQPR